MSGAAALAFCSGVAVLALELGGARWLSPVFGATLDVWCAVLSVTLGALALGYAAGGGAARGTSPTAAKRRLAWCFAWAGAWVLLIAYSRRWVLGACVELGLVGGALASAILLLGVPLAFLGAASPLCLRLHLEDGEALGRSAGALWAVSTAGSVAGALAAGLWLVPAMPLESFLGALGAGLLAMSAAARPAAGLGRAAWWVAPVLAAAWVLRPRPAETNVIDRAQSLYGEIVVQDSQTNRALFIDGVMNTVIDRETGDSTSEYIKGFELVSFFRPAAKRVLLVGLGAGSLVHGLKAHYGIVTDVIEIDPGIVAAARKWFAFEPPGTLTVADGRRGIEAAAGAGYDALFLDAFAGDQHPFHLFSREAVQAAKATLAPEGVMAVNLIGYAKGPRSGLWRSVAATLRESFPHVRVFIASRQAQPMKVYVNILLFASAAPLEFRADPAAGRPVLSNLYGFMRAHELDAQGPAVRGAPVLTDDYNPVDELNRYAFGDIRRDTLRFSVAR